MILLHRILFPSQPQSYKAWPKASVGAWLRSHLEHSPSLLSCFRRVERVQVTNPPENQSCLMVAQVSAGWVGWTGWGREGQRSPQHLKQLEWGHVNSDPPFVCSHITSRGGASAWEITKHESNGDGTWADEQINNSSPHKKHYLKSLWNPKSCMLSPNKPYILVNQLSWESIQAVNQV